MTGRIRSVYEKHKNNILLCVLSVMILYSFSVYLNDRLEYVEKTSVETNTKAVKLLEGEQIRQSISFDRADAFGFSIQFGSYQKVIDGELTVTLSDQGEEIEIWKIPMRTIKDNEYHDFLFNERGHIVADKEYELNIDAKYDSSDILAVWTGEKEGGSLYRGNERKKGSVVAYKTLYKMNSMKTAIMLWMGLIMLLLNIAFFMNVNEKNCAALVLSAVSIVFFLIFPLNDVPDEEAHFLRSFEVSCGQLMSKHKDDGGQIVMGGNYLPRALLDYDDVQAEISWDDVTYLSFSGASLYSPTNYFPQALGMKIARVFTNNVSKIFYAGRLGAYLFFLFCCLLAIYWVPFGIRPFTIILLFPMTMQEGISLSADSITIGLSVLFFALVIRLASHNRKIRRIDMVLLLLIACLLALSKIVYIVLIFLIWLIPKEQFKNKAHYRITMIAIPIVAVIVNGMWLMISSSYLTEFREGVAPGEQVRFVLMNIPTYINTIVRTVWMNGSLWISSAIGSSLGWFVIPVNGLVWIGFFCAYTVELAATRVSGIWNDVKKKMIVTFVLLSGCGLICTSLYVQWTDVGYELIEGIQGRYFIPLLPAFSLLIIMSGKQTTPGKGNGKEGCWALLYLVLLLLNGIAIIDVLSVVGYKFI